MIKLEKTEVWGFEHAVRGMRNPLNSWDKIDSGHVKVNGVDSYYKLGPSDLSLMRKLVAAGTDHRKFMRQIFVSVDITAPLYWWKEFDTYKVGTVANSCSTMHKIQEKEFTLDDFSHEHLVKTNLLDIIIDDLNSNRTIYNDYDNQSDEFKAKFSKKDVWWQMIQLLPSSYNQTRTVTMNYENVYNMYHARRSHKLDEWRIGFCSWVEKELPYAHELIMLGGNYEGC